MAPQELEETASLGKACHCLYNSGAACPGAHLPAYPVSPACLQEASGNKALLWKLSREPSSSLGLKSQMLFQSGRQGDVNFYRSTTRGQSVTAGDLESATDEPTSKSTGRGKSSRTSVCSSSQFSFPGASPGSWRSLYDYRHSPCSGSSHPATPTGVQKFLSQAPFSRWGESSVRKEGVWGMGQRDPAVSQTSSQARKCHSLVPLDVDHFHLMQRKGEEANPDEG